MRIASPLRMTGRLMFFCGLWLALGLVAHAEEERELTAEDRQHWSFLPVQHPPVPVVAQPELVNNPIDAFLLEKLTANGQTFSPKADRRTLIRRLSYDLRGLPPTPEEVAEFLADERPDAYEQLIDRFLASPEYGETWGRVWLDLVRFAETAGFNADPARPLAYKYRDYVIRAFNDNMPYDRFVQEQLAGDELFPEEPAAHVATGYNRMWPDESNASDILLARQTALNDLTANVGAVYLGLTLGCAQCHDHKFDPLLQRDFYQIQAFFSGIVFEDRAVVGQEETLKKYQESLEKWLSETAEIRDVLHGIESKARAVAAKEKRKKFPAIVLEAIDTAPEKRTTLQHQLVFWSERQIDLKEEDMLKRMSNEEKEQRTELREQYKQLAKKRPAPPSSVSAMVVSELPTGPAPMFLLAGGSYDKPLKELAPQYITVMQPEHAEPPTITPVVPGSSGRRAALAKWITSPENTLTSRVMVNRIWQEHFGLGIVSNANDFGTQTPEPSHPELLDWLATEFVRSGWDIKAMHRLILTSAAFQQITFRDTTEGELSKPEREALYGCYPRRRLTGEKIRDAVLQLSGQLTPEMFGPGVRPELPPDFANGWKPSENPKDRTRRSVYIYAKRNLPYPLLQAFDFPDMHESCAQRAQTIVSPQALMLLNSEMILGYAADIAKHLMEGKSPNELPQAIQAAYELALARPATPEEIEGALTFISQQQEIITQDNPKQQSNARHLALTDFCHALLNSNEFLYID